MNFTAYIERQKKIIRKRHEGETILISRGQTLNLSEEDEIFYELSRLKGLNVRERSYNAA